MYSFIQSITADSWISNTDEQLGMLNSNLDKIPEIGFIPFHCLQSGQLVRFRGMIQDMADPVLYLRRYEVVNNKTGSKEMRYGKYKDILSVKEDEIIDEDSPNLEHSERRSLYCVSVPGLNDWVKPPNSPSLVESTCDSMEISTATDGSNQVKRNVQDMEEHMDTHPGSTLAVKKQQRTQENSNDERFPILLNYPVDSSNNYSCLINVYEDLDEKLIKMNSVVDVVGFVSFTSDCDDFTHLPATLVPRLHAVSFKRITHSNPFHSSILDQSIVLSKAEKVRRDFLSILSQLFFGDTLLAEYILCNLISRIYHRDELLTLGHFSVNVTKVPLENNYPQEVFNILKGFVPKSHYIPMSLERMNSDKFLPEKDYEYNCLKSGMLQLTDHTCLFLDETKMEPGQLNANGISNLKALDEVIRNQNLNYDFKYVKIEFPVDLPVIVLSEGKSLLSTDVQVILNPEAGCTSVDEILTSVKEILKDPLLTEIRHYLIATSHSEFNLADDLIETIQRDYVKLRQEERKVNESDLHLLLILSRLISLSYGHTSLTNEMWDKAFEMELFRKERINNREP